MNDRLIRILLALVIAAFIALHVYAYFENGNRRPFDTSSQEPKP